MSAGNQQGRSATRAPSGILISTDAWSKKTRRVVSSSPGGGRRGVLDARAPVSGATGAERANNCSSEKEGRRGLRLSLGRPHLDVTGGRSLLPRFVLILTSCCGSRSGKLWAAAKEDPATASSVGAWAVPPCSVGQGKGKTRVAVNLVGNGSD